jgi:hypothetical protein
MPVGSPRLMLGDIALNPPMSQVIHSRDILRILRVFAHDRSKLLK